MIPVNRHPLLLCQGTCPPGHVHHIYIESVVVKARFLGEESVAHIDHVFECDECGTRRVYGRDAPYTI